MSRIDPDGGQSSNYAAQLAADRAADKAWSDHLKAEGMAEQEARINKHINGGGCDAPDNTMYSYNMGISASGEPIEVWYGIDPADGKFKLVGMKNGDITSTNHGISIFNRIMEAGKSNIRIKGDNLGYWVREDGGSFYEPIPDDLKGVDGNWMKTVQLIDRFIQIKPFEDFGGQEKQQSQFYFGIEDELTVGPQASVNIKGALGANLSLCKWSIYSLNFNNIDGFNLTRMGQNGFTKITNAYGLSCYGGISYEHSFMGAIGYAKEGSETHMLKFGIIGFLGAEFNFDENWNLNNSFYGVLINPEIGLIINGERKFKLGIHTTYK